MYGAGFPLVSHKTKGSITAGPHLLEEIKNKDLI